MRKTRSDKKPDGQKMDAGLPVKFTAVGRTMITIQASRARMGVARYLRWLASQDRSRLKLNPHDYNAGV